MSVRRLKKIITPKQRVLAALLAGKIDRAPVSSVAGCGGTVNTEMMDAVGIYWPDAHRDAEKMARLAIASYELSGLECVRVPFDFVIEAEALGCEVKFGTRKDYVPAVIEHLYKKPEDLKMPDNLLELGRIPIVLDAIRMVRKEVGDYLPISSLVLGPFTLAGELAGIHDLLVWTVKKPEYIRKFVDFSTDVIIEYGKAQYRAGSDIVQVGDPSASCTMISPDMFRDFVKPALTKIADNLGGISVLHICGDVNKIVSDLADCGYHGISIEEDVDIAKAKSIVGDKVRVLGNISSKDTLIFGPPERVKAETTKALEAGADLLEPGCGIAPPTPTEYIKAMVEAAKEFKPKT